MLIAGCDQVFGLSGRDGGTDRQDGGTGGDACILGDLDPGVVYPMPPMFTGHFDAALSADQLELFSAAPSAKNGLEIVVSRRETTLSPWGNPTPLDRLSSMGEESDPSITEDGLVLVFYTNRNGRPGLWQVTRDNLGAEWNAGAPLSELDVNVRSAEISADGLRLYVVDGDQSSSTLYRYHRMSRSSPFENPMVLATGALYPSVSRDETELFFHDEGIKRMIGDGTGGFADPALLIPGAKDPDISFDNSTLIFTQTNSEGGFAQIRRSCQ